jgi:hypothetical protein
MFMKKIITLLLVIFSLACVFPAAAQQPGLQIYLSRKFGYSSGTGKVQGLFSLQATGPADLQRVVFYINDQVIGEAAQSPFKIEFRTDSYPLGVHTLSAVGYTPGGQALRSNEIKVQFVTAQEGWQAGLRIAGPLLAITLGLVALSFLASFASAGKLKNLPLGAPRSYGVAGGSICPRCGRPFSRHVMSPNMVVGKLERCPFCGKWSIVAAVPLAQLRAAEAAELKESGASLEPALAGSEEELRRALEDSRYREASFRDE